MKWHAMTLPATALALLAAAACSENPLSVDEVAINASSVHLKGGANAEPSFRDNGLALAVSGALSGLGNGDVLVSITATANVTSTCTNQGGNAAPGQNPAPTTVTAAWRSLSRRSRTARRRSRCRPKRRPRPSRGHPDARIRTGARRSMISRSPPPRSRWSNPSARWS